MNLYTYVHNNPLRYIDPSGHVAVERAEFEINWQINQQKKIWEENNNIMKNVAVGSGDWVKAYVARSGAEKTAQRLRAENPNMNLLSASDPYMETATIGGSVYEGAMRAMVDPYTNIIYYPITDPNPRGTYYEQSVQQNGFSYWQGMIVKEAVDFVTFDPGKQAKGVSPFTLSILTKGLLTVVGSAEVPNLGSRRTIIYFDNTEKNFVARLVVVTENGKVVSVDGWEHI